MSKRQRRLLLLLAAAIVAIAGLWFTTPYDGYSAGSHEYFRAVRVNGQWHAFDPGERPDLDGAVLIEQAEAVADSADFLTRVKKSAEWHAVNHSFIFVVGPCSVEREQVQLTRHHGIPWLRRLVVEIDGFAAREVLPGEAPRHIELTHEDLTPALHAIANYVDLHAPRKNLGHELRKGLGSTYEVYWPQWPILLLHILIIAGAGWLVVSAFRSDAAKQTIRASPQNVANRSKPNEM
ncbi:MAG: hypothetical protein ACKVW3_12290 [Phycisphaerales bacterium]